MSSTDAPSDQPEILEDVPYAWEEDLQSVPSLLEGAQLVAVGHQNALNYYELQDASEDPEPGSYTAMPNEEAFDRLIKAMVAKVDFTGDDVYAEMNKLENRLHTLVCSSLGDSDPFARCREVEESIHYGLVEAVRSARTQVNSAPSGAEASVEGAIAGVRGRVTGGQE